MLSEYFNYKSRHTPSSEAISSILPNNGSISGKSEPTLSDYINNTAPPLPSRSTETSYENDSPEIDYKINKYKSYLDNLYHKYYYLTDGQFLKLVKDTEDTAPLGLTLDVVKEYLRRRPGRQIVDFRYAKDLPFASIKKPGYYQMDIVFFIPQIPHLYLVEMNSRKVWSIPIRNKSGAETLNAFQKWYFKLDEYGNIQSKRRVISIMSDMEKGFEWQQFKDFCDKQGIQLFKKDPSEHKIEAILDRSVSTVKKLLYKRLVDFEFEAPAFSVDIDRGEKRIIDPKFARMTDSSGKTWEQKFNEHVQGAITDYNNKPHSSLREYTPNEVYNSPQLQKRMLVESVRFNWNNKEKIKKMHKVTFEVGDLVRFDERRKKLDKATFWSDQVYRIIKKNHYSYILGDADGNFVQGVTNQRFKHYELQLVRKGSKHRHNPFDQVEEEEEEDYFNERQQQQLPSLSDFLGKESVLRKIVPRIKKRKGDRSLV